MSVGGRLLLSPPADGPTNMAVDAALLRCLVEGSMPTLRFYSWSSPTLSLGYFQPLKRRGEHPSSRGLAVVRRASGGGAIVHDHELTYSLVMPARLLTSAASTALYGVMHGAIINAFAEAGVQLKRFAGQETVCDGGEPFLCFQRRTAADVMLGGYKVLGSAQRRGRHGVLQHGSLLLAASTAAPELPGIADLCGRSSEPQELGQRIAAALTEPLGLTWHAGQLTEAEIEAAEQLHASKFANPKWNAKR